MKHYLITHQYLADGSTAIGAIQEFDSLDKAKSAWHSTMAYNMVAENVIGSLTLIYTGNGQIELNDYWQRTDN